MTKLRLLLAGLLLLPVSALCGDQQIKTASDKETASPQRKARVKLGGIFVGAGYTHYSGPRYFADPYRYYPYAYWYYPPYWDPFWGPYLTFYHPGFFTGFLPGEDMGEVKLAAEPKNAEVFLDGAYAGTADALKSMWLAPGAYNLALKVQNRAPFQRRIYVLTGKTLKITATLAPAAEVKP